jgi:1-pyrroline-5-carboxylate dehydrogenase
MGGKNPTIVTKNADLDKATDGVLRSAFGFGGQKCSACSRVFVEREVYDDFLTQLKTKTEKLKVGNPLERDVFLGPIINEAAMDTFEEAAEEAGRTATSSPVGSGSPRASLARDCSSSRRWSRRPTTAGSGRRSSSSRSLR